MPTYAEIWSELARARVVPVVVADGESDGLNVADALRRGHLPIAEITFRVAGAADAIRAITEDCPEVLVGAGTVIRPDQVDAAVEAGAKFLVSPGVSESVVRRAREFEIPIIPGVATPSDIMRAIDLGLDTVKLFPAGALGGPTVVKALAAPFPGLRFVPTGGISLKNMGDYLMLPQVLAIGGSWMVDRELVQGEDWERITELSRDAVELAEQVVASRPLPHPADLHPADNLGTEAHEENDR